MTLDNNEPIIIRNSRKEYAFHLLLATLLTTAAYFCATRAGGFVKFVGWFGMLFFGAGIVIFIFQIFDRRPRLIIDSRGIHDRTLNIGHIDWADIEDAWVRDVHRTCFICLELTDDEKYLSRMPPNVRRVADANRALGFQRINLNVGGTTTDAHELCEFVLQRAREARC